MSDRSSESSEGWVVLNKEEELASEDLVQPLNLDLNYDAVCDAISDSIRSSPSVEELEWQYEHFEDYISSDGISYVEDLDSKDSDVECNENEDSNAEDDVISNQCTSSEIEEDNNLDLGSISKIRCYKHDRNDHLNFILNMMLALAVASAIGLGTGHFLGWSDKCYNSLATTNRTANFLHVLDGVSIHQSDENTESSKEQIVSLQPILENVSDSASCLNSKSYDNPGHQEICTVSSYSDISDNFNSENSIHMTSNVIEFKSHEKLPQSNFSGFHDMSAVKSSNSNGLSNIENTIERLNDLNQAAIISMIENSPMEDEVNDIEIEFPKHYYKEKSSKVNKNPHTDSSSFSILEDNLFNIDIKQGDQSESPKELFLESFHKDVFKESSLSNQLKHDINEVIQSLSAFALAHLADFDEKNLASIENSQMIVKLYHDFQNLINARLSEIDNFVLSANYKKYQKVGLKHLQKMMYSLLDSVDYLMKISFKTLSKDSKKINVHKFSNNISKVIFNFNKKWDKNGRSWSQIVEKAKLRENQEELKRKRNRYSKRKPRFEKHNFQNHKFEHYSMKS